MSTTFEQEIAPDESAESTPRRRRRRPRRRHQDTKDLGILAVICLVSLLALAAFVSYTVYGATPAPWQTVIAELRQRNAAFTVAGATLGMTPAEMRHIHPDMSSTVGRDGSEKAAFRHQGGRYTVWFLRPSQGHKAYRIRYQEAFEGSEEQAVHDSLMRAFGMPTASDCDRGGVTADKACRFRWWVGDGVAVDAGTQVVKSFPVRSQTSVTVMATDTRLEGRQRRAHAAAPRVPRPLRRQAATILPF